MLNDVAMAGGAMIKTCGVPRIGAVIKTDAVTKVGTVAQIDIMSDVNAVPEIDAVPRINSSGMIYSMAGAVVMSAEYQRYRRVEYAECKASDKYI